MIVAKACRGCGKVIVRRVAATQPGQNRADANFARQAFCSRRCRKAGALRPIDPRLLPGEVIAPACKDCIPCACPSTFKVAGIGCLHVARAAGFDRCLGCGRRWMTRRYRWQLCVEVAA